MEEIGLVIATEGKMARVRLTRRASCDKCGICGLGKAPEIIIDVPNTIDARPGQAVRLVMEEGNLFRAAAAAYLVPLGALLAGYLLARAVLSRLGLSPPSAEFFAVVTGFLFLGLSYFWLRRYDRRRGAQLTPRMLAVVETPPPEE